MTGEEAKHAGMGDNELKLVADALKKAASRMEDSMRLSRDAVGEIGVKVEALEALVLDLLHIIAPPPQPYVVHNPLDAEHDWSSGEEAER